MKMLKTMKKKKKGSAMEQAIDSMIDDTEKHEYEEKLKPILTIKVGKLDKK